MNDAIISASFQPLIGLPCWGVVRVHGSILSLEFGRPRLSIREPYVSSSESAKVRQLAARRRVKPVGEWNLTILYSHWSIGGSGKLLANNESDGDQIEAAARALDGQRLTAVALDASRRETTFSFDLGSALTTWETEAGDEEQWSLYLPHRHVLTYRADGRYSYGPGNEAPDQEIWHIAERSIRVP